MENIKCCEMMLVIIDTDEKIVRMIKEVSKDFSTSSPEEAIATVWKNGGEYSSFLIADKFWKEDRLCAKCIAIFKEMQEKSFPKIIEDMKQFSS